MSIFYQINADTLKMFLFTVSLVSSFAATMLIAYFSSKFFVNVELYKLNITNSNFEKVVIIASGIILSSIIIILGVLLITIVSKCFYLIPDQVFYSYTKLMFSFSAMLIIGYTVVAPNHSNHRLMNISDEEAKIIHKKSSRIATISFIVTVISYPIIILITNPEYKISFEFIIVAVIVCYYFLEMVTFRKTMSSIFNVQVSKKASLAQKLSSFINDKFHYFAFAGMLCIVFVNSSNQNPHEFLIFSCMNSIYIFLVSAFIFQSVISYIINKFNEHIDELRKSDKSERYIESRSSNITWICDVSVLFSYFAMCCIGINLLGFNIIENVVHNIITTIIVTTFIATIICKIYNEYKEEILENAVHGDKNHYEKLKVFIVPISVVFYSMVAITSLMVMLANIGVDIFALMVNFSLVVSGIWWVTKDIIESFLKGVILMLERNISVGEFVKVNGFMGTVEKLSLRVMHLRDLNGSVNIIPYTCVTSITNYSKDYSNHYDELLLSDSKDVDKAKEILIKVVDNMKREGAYKDIIIGDVIINGISPFDLKGVKIAWVIRTNTKGTYVVNAIYDKLIKEFKKHKIKIPSSNNIGININ